MSNYKVTEVQKNIILEKLSKTSYRSIFYIGHADEDLIVALKDKYKISFADWFDKTNKSTEFWCEGMPEHEVLILDLPIDWELYSKSCHRKPAEIVFLLGDTDSINFNTSYSWFYEGIWIGVKTDNKLRNLYFDMTFINSVSYTQNKKDTIINKIINDAEAIIITAGAGMGVDSGLPDFRGNKGFWKAYPPIAKLGYDFTQMANPALFTYKPQLAWGFYGHRLNLYRSTITHGGFKLLRDMVSKINDNYFVFTSNVDGQFQKAGFDEDKIYEVHGSIHQLQCTTPCKQEVWANNLGEININIDTLEAEEQPRCKYCSKLSRPNILMFGDYSFVTNRADEQSARFYEWKERNQSKKTVIIEIGAGSVIPTIRNFGDEESKNINTTLIRINPREYEITNDGDISIALGGLEGIKHILNATLF